MQWSLILMVSLCCLPRGVDAACCQLVKIESEPSVTRVRVCDSSEGADCAQPNFEGDVGFGNPVAVCTTTESVTYRELDPGSGVLAAPITARCDAATNVEL